MMVSKVIKINVFFFFFLPIIKGLRKYEKVFYCMTYTIGGVTKKEREREKTIVTVFVNRMYVFS